MSRVSSTSYELRLRADAFERGKVRLERRGEKVRGRVGVPGGVNQESVAHEKIQVVADRAVLDS